MGPYKDNGSSNNSGGTDWPPTVPARSSRRPTLTAGSTSPNSIQPLINTNATTPGPVPPTPPHYIPPPSIYPEQFHNRELQQQQHVVIPPPPPPIQHDVNVNRIQSPRSEVKLNSMP